jgi:hypothetical protein
MRALSAYPFGSPDASNEASAPSPFIPVDRPPDEARAISGDVNPDVRVLVGRMGAGKTRCLVEVRKHLEAEGACELTPIEFDLPSLTYVTRLAEDLAVEPVERAEVWRKIWRRAIVRAALSHVMPRTQSRHAAAELVVDHLDGVDRCLIPDAGLPRSIYADFGGILRDHAPVSQLRAFLDNPGWDRVEYLFEELIRQRDTPLCFFLDSGEEDSSHAPRYWLWCQLGLVREVLHVTQNERLEDKLRIFVAIRDQTWAELGKAGRPLLYEQHPRVRQLRWGPRSAARFLAEKIRQLPDEYLLAKRTGSDDPQSLVSTWLGADAVSNGRGPRVTEPITVYLLRHTRLIPRDIVSVGNLLTLEVLAARRRGDREVPERCIQNAVSESARLSANEELHACALEIIAHQLASARNAADRRRTVPDEDAASRILETLKELLARCEEDVVAREKLSEIDTAATERLGAPGSLGDMLWRRGLIGWSVDKTGPYTFRVNGAVALPPSNRAGFVALHPCLVDELGLEPAGESVVVPFVETELT